MGEIEEEFNEFDVVHADLEGSNIIEASAGTGKTFNITRIFLRLLIEKEIKIGEILVVTFTIAATSELRERIYSLIEKSYRIFQDFDNKKPSAEDLQKRYSADRQHAEILLRNYKNKKRVLKLLSEAMRNFDESSIFTIHGFAGKLLFEQSFETGSLFQMEVLESQSAIEDFIIKDSWRKLAYGMAPDLLKFALSNGMFYESFYSMAKDYVKSEADDVFQIKKYDGEGNNKYSEYYGFAAAIRNHWKTSSDVIQRLLNESKLNQIYYKQTKLDELYQEMDRWADSESESIQNLKYFDLLCLDKINLSVTKNSKKPEHEIFADCRKLKDIKIEIELRLINAYLGALPEIKKEIFLFKEKNGIATYDDLIDRIYKTLRNERRKSQLQNIVSSKYSAALIDEFQDTDKKQWHIFYSLFVEMSKILFIIGDPKQSIYRFRGADIDTYTAAKKIMRKKHTLTKNFRSTPEMLEALDEIYKNAESHVFKESRGSFLSDDIHYRTVQAGKDFNQEFYPHQETKAPLQFIIRDNYEELSEYELTAEHIADLLKQSEQGNAYFKKNDGSKKILKPSDIAVIVNKNRQAFEMQTELRKKNVNSILNIDSSVLKTPEAQNFLKVLKSLEFPEKIPVLVSALSTDMMGWNANDILMLLEMDAVRNNLIYKFKELADERGRRGFMYVFQYIMNTLYFTPEFNRRIAENGGEILSDDLKTPAELILSFSGGERMIMNCMHLAELLQMQTNQTISEDIEWFHDEIAMTEDAISSEERMIRLESDRDAVQILNVHKSKGLEFPVIYFPGLWNHSLVNKSEKYYILNDAITDKKMFLPDVVYNIIEDDKKCVDEFGDKFIADIKAMKQRKELQDMQEGMRVLYVALTRSIYRSYFVWGVPTRSGKNPAYFLLHGNNKLTPETIAESLEKFQSDNLSVIKYIKNLCPPRSFEEFQNNLISPGGGSLNVRRDYFLSSYTGIVKKGTQNAEDYDGEAINYAPDPFESPKFKKIENSYAADVSIFSFEKGARSGIFLHKLFETVSFSADKNDILRLTDKSLHEFGYEPVWRDVIASCIYTVLNTPLSFSPTFRLCEIEEKDKASEMPFMIPVISDKIINISDMPESEDFRLLRSSFKDFKLTVGKGFLQGVADLIFRRGNLYYLLDWKSNHLGYFCDDYTPEKIENAMIRDRYILQYYLYIIAVNKFLTETVPGYDYENNFGGVFYLFIRGMDGTGKTGIFFDRPSQRSLNWFENNFCRDAESKEIA